MDKHILKNAVEEGLSIRGIMEKFNASNGSVRYWLKKYNLKTNGNYGNVKWSKELIEDAMVGAICMSDILIQLKLSIRAGNYFTLKKYAKIYGINLPKYKYQRGNKHKRILTNDDIFIKDSDVSRGVVKRRLIEEGRGRECEICYINDQWMGEKLVMVLDHKNGINNDNRKDNLRFVCPNCNSTLDTHCRKNK